MKITFTKDYQPTEEVVRDEITAAGLPMPDVLEVSGSVVEASYVIAPTIEDIEKLRGVLARLGYFLNK